MATTTTNLGLTKPALSESADVGVINDNSDKIDVEAGKSRANLAATYSATSAYAVGDYCERGGNLYRCTTAIASGGEAWDSGHWTQVAMTGELSSVIAQISGSEILEQKEKITSGNWNDFTTERVFYYTTTDAPNFTNAPDGAAAGVYGWVGVVLKSTEYRVIQIAFQTSTIKYRYFNSSVWGDWYTFKPLLYKEVTATTTSNGNINIGISHSDYAVVSALCTTADTIAIPERYNGTNWGVHVCSSASSMAAVASTSVTVKVWYQSITSL